MSTGLDVALIVPPTDLTCSTEDPTMERLGVGYLAARLQAAGLSVRVWHCPAQGLDALEAARQIADSAPALVGVSVLFSHTDLPGTLALAQALRARGCQAHLTLGGHAATFLAGPLLESAPEIDTVVRGEGEETLNDLASRVVRAADWQGIPGISRRCEGAAVHNDPRPLIADLDRLPFPARSHVHWSGMVASSRGCPYHCIFCSVHPFYRQSPGKLWRARSAANVVDEIESLKKAWGLNRITFVDDNFMGPGRVGRQRAVDLGRELIRRKTYVEFLVDARADAVDEETLSFLKLAGLKTVFLGIESGSQRALNFLNKNMRVETNRRALETLHRLGLEVLIGFITFDPFTTLSDLRDNIRFYEQTGLSENTAALSRFFGQLKVFRGTVLESNLREQGLLRGANGLGPDLEYRFVDPRAQALAQVAQQVSNQPGRSYVLSHEFKTHQERLLDMIQLATGLSSAVVHQVLAARGWLAPGQFERWQTQLLRQAFRTFASLVEELEGREAPPDGDGLAEQLKAEMQTALEAVDRQVLGMPFDQAMQQMKRLTAAASLRLDYQGQQYEVDLQSISPAGVKTL